MTDTTEPTGTITGLISIGTTEQALLSAVARQFPDLSPPAAQLSASACGAPIGRSTSASLGARSRRQRLRLIDVTIAAVEKRS